VDIFIVEDEVAWVIDYLKRLRALSYWDVGLGFGDEDALAAFDHETDLCLH
jgi:hypothetical protein